MAIRDFLPFNRPVGFEEKKRAQILPLDDQKALVRGFKVAALALGFQGIPTSINARATFEMAPYDFDRIIQAIDTDSYAKQAFAKWRELFWKEGWILNGENSEAVDYLYQRLDFMEIAMNRPFQDFLTEVIDQLIRFHNVFIVKSRSSTLNDLYPDDLYPVGNLSPIVGYYIIPTEKVEIMRDKNNRVQWYRQRLDDTAAYFEANNSPKGPGPVWNARDVIHLYRDRKPGRAFGTPFLTATLDDIVALRQIEEDVQNLIHRELFPLYKYRVGTDEFPASPEEIDQAVLELEGLRSEGGLVLPHRHDVDVIGAQGNTLDITQYLKHFKERVSIGLGLFPHHLGMSGNGGNMSATDRLDIALYDKVKEYQRYVADSLRLQLFDELLREGGFDPMINPHNSGQSDRCIMKFREIDTDTQTKKDAAVIAKVQSQLQTIPEGRLELGMDPEIVENETAQAMSVRLTPTMQVVAGAKDKSGGNTSPKMIDTTPPAALKPGQGQSSKPGKQNTPVTGKGAANVIRPANQHGTRTSPNIRHDAKDENWLKEVVELIDSETIEE